MSAVVIELFLFQIQVRQEQVVFPEAEVLNSNLVKIIKLRLKHELPVVVVFSTFSQNQSSCQSNDNEAFIHILVDCLLLAFSTL